jgi:hypothetical protein
VVFRLSAGRSAFELGDDLKSRLAAEAARGSERDPDDVRRLEPQGPIRLVTLAVEQLALVTEDWFHSMTFRLDDGLNF